MPEIGIGVGLNNQAIIQQGAGAVVAGIALSNNDFDDNAGLDTVVGSLSTPEGYTLDLLHDDGGKFSLQGSNLLYTGLVRVPPGTYSPYIRAKKEGALDLTLRPNIVANAAFEPSDISGLQLALVCDQGTTVNESNELTAWLGAFGTVVNASGVAGTTAPAVLQGAGPKGKSPISMPTGKFLSLSEAVNFDDATIILVWRPRAVDGTTRYTLGLNAGGFALGHHSNIFDVNFGSTASVIPAANYNIITNRFQCSIITHDGVNGSGPTLCYTDGSAAGASANAGVTARSIDRIGKNGATINENSEFTAILIYNRILTSDEIAQVEAWAQQYRTTEWFFASEGNQSNTGFNEANAKQNPASTINASSTSPPMFRPGDQIKCNGGDFFYDQAITATNVFNSNAARPIVITGFGTGKPRFWSAQPSELTWTLDTGDVWTAPLTRTNAPTVLWWYRDGLNADPVHIYNRTVDEDESFSFASNVLTIQLAAGVDPNDEVIVIPKDASSGSLFGGSKTDLIFKGIEARHYVGQILAGQSARNHVFENDFGFCVDDAVSPGAGGTMKVLFNRVRDCGASRSTSSGPGDGISLHGGGSNIVGYNDIADCKVAGVRNEMGTGCEVCGNVINNCNQGIRVLYNASFDTPSTQLIRSNHVTRSADDQEAAGIKVDSQVTANITVTVEDNVLVGEGATRGKAIDNASPNAIFTQARNQQTGFSSLT